MNRDRVRFGLDKDSNDGLIKEVENGLNINSPIIK